MLHSLIHSASVSPMNRPKIHCKDGVSLSVQASEYHYCSPRNNVGPYECFEVGFIEKDSIQFVPPSSWAQYADGEFPSDVYGYVPIKLIEEFIEEHGGMDVNKLLNSHNRLTLLKA